MVSLLVLQIRYLVSFGSGKFVKQGFYMNNSLTNFSSDPNSPNYGGKHKAPRSYTSPSIVVGPISIWVLVHQVETKFLPP